MSNEVMTSIEPRELDTAAMPPEEKELVNKVVSMFKRSKKEKDKFSNKWDKFDKYLSGDQWDKARPAWRSDIVVNWIKTVVEDFLAIMTDNSPRILIQGKEGENSKVAEIMGILMEEVWTKNKMDLKLPLCAKNALSYGNGFLKVLWDGVKDNIGIINIDPRNLFPDTGSTDTEDWEWVNYAVYRHINYVRQRYPERGNLVVPGKWAGFGEDVQLKRRFTAAHAEVTSPVTTTDNSQQYFYDQRNDYSAVEGDLRDMCLVLECWWMPTEEYPDGRRVTIANGVVLIDGPNPFNHKRIPFVKVDDMPRPGIFWSEGEVEQLMKPNVGYNKLLGQLIDILNYTANPVLVFEGSVVGTKKKTITNRPGNTFYLENGARAYWLQPSSPPPMLAEALNILRDAINNISGKQDALVGKKPSAVTAGRAILALQEAAQTRLRIKIRNMESALEEVGRLCVSLFQQFYTEPMSVKTKDPMTGEDAFIPVNQKTDAGMVNSLQMPGEYDVKVVAGSTMPKHKQARFEQAIELGKLNYIDRPEVLKASDWPNWEEVDRRMVAREQAEMQAQMIQSQQTALPEKTAGMPEKPQLTPADMPEAG